MDISKIDKNFKVETKLQLSDVRFYDVLQEPFALYGLFYENGKLRRLPEAVAKSVNDGVYGLHANTAGGRVRFMTDSPYVAIVAKMPFMTRSSNLSFDGAAGFDLYEKVEGAYTYRHTFQPPIDAKDGFESLYRSDTAEMHIYELNLPTYSDVSELYIGLYEGARLEAGEPYCNELPVVYLGSSITQGGCASRPGMAYEAIVSRALNLHYINLGFSGSCRGEEEMIDYVASLPMSVFVYDYDHNAPTLEHLEKTHEKGFLRIREKNPDLPIIMMTAPYWNVNAEWQGRRDLIRQNYERALARGDKNVYLLTAHELLALCKNEGTVDGTHPTDFGFHSMSVALIPVLKRIFNM